MNNNKRSGTNILFINDKEEVLLFLRDNKINIPYPDCWDILGGFVEKNETPEECVIREMKEELGIELKKPALFKVSTIKNITENTFWKRLNLNIDEINLREGQKLKWFTEDEIKKLSEKKMHFGFKSLVLEFFKKRPFKNRKIIAFGTFDVFHPGHRSYLKQAKKLGDFLIVVVARDKNVLRIKNKKVLNKEQKRLEEIKKIKIADEVVLGNLKDKYAVIKKYKPDIIALGYDQAVDLKELKNKLKDFNLKSKIIRLKSHKPEVYKSSKLKIWKKKLNSLKKK